jgi:hypothetical protein
METKQQPKLNNQERSRKIAASKEYFARQAAGESVKMIRSLVWMSNGVGSYFFSVVVK